ncbi:ABC transporter substrate-binding protein [Ferrovibrio sp.]|uniref:substrate-binding periplasmic protein n=1 Tax=Ferrovibrio sp. TaxID=1917215 RepID=UPI0025BFC69C|nr:transporter substrate-binding domain-containing protein [Ferrovibrio sp.]MBX3454530.1 transporter substrate-binding domain-containing protein [Ferrovibrio sp.]
MSLQPCCLSDLRRFGLGLLLLLFLLPGPVCKPANAAEVVIGFRLVPPYVMEAEDGGLHGLEYELVREVLALTGHGMQARILPFSRLIEDFRRGRLPAFVPANPVMNLSGAFSDVMLVYNNVGLSLQARRIMADRADSLRGLRIVAFQNARRLLPGFLDIQERNPDYLEVADQTLQVRALFAGRADLIVGERRILQVLIRSVQDSAGGVAIREHALFPPTYYRAVFADASLRDDFNQALERFKRSGEYERLLARYDIPVQIATP